VPAASGDRRVPRALRYPSSSRQLSAKDEFQAGVEIDHYAVLVLVPRPTAFARFERRRGGDHPSHASSRFRTHPI
jgi:hypothetical protein